MISTSNIYRYPQHAPFWAHHFHQRTVIASRLNIANGVDLGARAVSLCEDLAMRGLRVQVYGGAECGHVSLPTCVIRRGDLPLVRSYGETHSEAVEVAFRTLRMK